MSATHNTTELRNYASIHEIPALNYFWFLLYYRLYANTSLLHLGGYDEFITSIEALCDAKVRHIEIAKRCRNERTKLRNTNLGIDYAYCAFACAIDPKVRPSDIESMTITAVSTGVSYPAMLTYLDHLQKTFVYESDMIEHNSDIRSKASIIRAHLANVSIDEYDNKYAILRKLLLNKSQFAETEIEETNELTSFRESFARLRISLGYNEDDLRTMTAYDFLIKIKMEQEKQKAHEQSTIRKH